MLRRAGTRTASFHTCISTAWRVLPEPFGPIKIIGSDPSISSVAVIFTGVFSDNDDLNSLVTELHRNLPLCWKIRRIGVRPELKQRSRFVDQFRAPTSLVD